MTESWLQSTIRQSAGDRCIVGETLILGRRGECLPERLHRNIEGAARLLGNELRLTEHLHQIGMRLELTGAIEEAELA